MEILSKYIKWILIFLIYSSFFSCQEPYYPENLDDKEQVIVVDGMISNLPGPYEVKLTWASPYGKSHNIFIQGATVVISDDEGNEEILQEERFGTYKTSPDGLIGIVGRTYKVTIILPDGSIYVSTPVMMDNAPVISDIGVAIGKEYNIERNYSGKVLVEEQIGVNVFVDIDTDTNTFKFYRFDIRYFKKISSPQGRRIELWNMDEYPNLRSAQHLDSAYIIHQHNIGFFPYENYVLYWVARIKTLCIDQEAYNYYESMNDQLHAREYIFDPVVSLQH